MESTHKRIQIQMDTQLVSEAKAILKELGLNQSTAITMFYKQVVNTHSIPFDVKLDPTSKKK